MNTPNEGIFEASSSSESCRDSQVAENLLRIANSNDTKGFITLLNGLHNFDLTIIADKKNYTRNHFYYVIINLIII